MVKNTTIKISKNSIYGSFGKGYSIKAHMRRLKIMLLLIKLGKHELV